MAIRLRPCMPTSASPPPPTPPCQHFFFSVRCEFKDLKEAARERLSVEYAQEKEVTLRRLRRSLGRGTGHSVGGLRGELWEEAQEKRARCVCCVRACVVSVPNRITGVGIISEARKQTTSGK